MKRTTSSKLCAPCAQLPSGAFDMAAINRLAFAQRELKPVPCDGCGQLPPPLVRVQITTARGEDGSLEHTVTTEEAPDSDNC